jgi:hypothetical protein
MTQRPLTPFLAKLDRADETMRAFDKELARVSHAKPLKVKVDVDFQSGWSTAYILHSETIPPGLSVLIGESLYHGRSVLEHLVWALVKANHKKPGKHHTFPAWDQPPRLEGARDMADAFIKITKSKQLAGVPMAAIALIERLQPYNRPDPSESFLSVLNRMARDDRHHALHGSHVGGRPLDSRGLLIDIEPVFVPARGYRIVEFVSLMREGKALVRGTKLARWRTVPLTRQNHVSVKGDIPSFIAFGDRKTGHILAQDFKKINAAIRQYLGAFEEFL